MVKHCNYLRERERERDFGFKWIIGCCLIVAIMVFKTKLTFPIPREYIHIWNKFEGFLILQGPIGDVDEGTLGLDYTFVGKLETCQNIYKWFLS